MGSGEVSFRQTTTFEEKYQIFTASASHPNREREKLLMRFEAMGAPDVDLAGNSCITTIPVQYDTRIRSPI